MKRTLTTLIVALMHLPMLASAEAVTGKAAPDFNVTDANGTAHSLSTHKGKWIVLEWFNKDCPYVKKHYDSGNMQKIQKTYSGKGVTWLTVISSAKGKQGHLTPTDTLKVAAQNKSAAHAILLDESGAMGKAYGAKVTPHMYIINPNGVVVYAGAIDDNDSASPKVIAKSKNYVSTALESALAGKPIEVASSRPYGCSVKY